MREQICLDVLHASWNVTILTLTQFGGHMVKVIEIYKNKSKNYESFGQGLDNKNMISLNKLM